MRMSPLTSPPGVERLSLMQSAVRPPSEKKIEIVAR